jgi:hypothetical protein
VPTDHPLKAYLARDVQSEQKSTDWQYSKEENLVGAYDLQFLSSYAACRSVSVKIRFAIPLAPVAVFAGANSFGVVRKSRLISGQE